MHVQQFFFQNFKNFKKFQKFQKFRKNFKNFKKFQNFKEIGLSQKPIEIEQNGRKFGIPWGMMHLVHMLPSFENFHFGGHFENSRNFEELQFLIIFAILETARDRAKRAKIWNPL